MSVKRKPKIVWDFAVAHHNEDAQKFAEGLIAALRHLTDNGFSITNQMQRGHSIVVIGQKTEATDLSQGAAAFIRAAATPAINAGGLSSATVLYNYIEWGVHKQQEFPTMSAALRRVREHLDDSGVPHDILPVSVVTLTTMRFEPPAFPALLRAFAPEPAPAKTQG